MVLAIIGDGEEVNTLPVVAGKYNIDTGVITLLKPDRSKIEVDTKIDRVALVECGCICNIFNGEVINYVNQ